MPIFHTLSDKRHNGMYNFCPFFNGNGFKRQPISFRSLKPEAYHAFRTYLRIYLILFGSATKAFVWKEVTITKKTWSVGKWHKQWFGTFWQDMYLFERNELYNKLYERQLIRLLFIRLIGLFLFAYNSMVIGEEGDRISWLDSIKTWLIVALQYNYRM